VRLWSERVCGKCVLSLCPSLLVCVYFSWRTSADNAVEGPGRVYEQPCPYGMREMFGRVYKVANVPLSKVRAPSQHGRAW
jgi:hypothetical protein